MCARRGIGNKPQSTRLASTEPMKYVGIYVMWCEDSWLTKCCSAVWLKCIGKPTSYCISHRVPTKMDLLTATGKRSPGILRKWFRQQWTWYFCASSPPRLKDTFSMWVFGQYFNLFGATLPGYVTDNTSDPIKSIVKVGQQQLLYILLNYNQKQLWRKRMVWYHADWHSGRLCFISVCFVFHMCDKNTCAM